MKQIQHTVVDIFNAGLGLIKAGEETVSTAVASVQESVASVQKSLDEAVANASKTYEDLKYKGASDYSEGAIKARDFVAGAARTVTGAKA